MGSAYFQQSPLRFTYPENFHGAVVESGNPGTRAIPELRAAYQLGPGPGMTWPCRSPWTFARILPNGNVELCFKFVVGNLYDRSFKDIWFGEEANAIRRHVIEETSICPACEYYRFCLRGGEVDTDSVDSYVSRHRLKEATNAPQPPRLIETIGDHKIVH